MYLGHYLVVYCSRKKVQGKVKVPKKQKYSTKPKFPPIMGTFLLCSALVSTKQCHIGVITMGIHYLPNLLKFGKTVQCTIILMGK